MATARKRISELTALTSASLDTVIVGVDNGTTYKIELDVLADAVTSRVNTLDRERLSSLESVTSSFETKGRSVVSSSAQITALGFTTTSSFQSFSSSVHSEILAATNEQDLTPYVTNLVYGVLSQSVDSRIDNLELNSGSYLTSLNGAITSSSQLTSSYDERYVLSGSITQTTWDNIANKPTGIVSQSVDIADFVFTSETITNGAITLHATDSDIVLNADGDVYLGSANSGNGIVTDGYLENIIGDTSMINTGTGHSITDNLNNIINNRGIVSSSTQIADLGFVTGSYAYLTEFNSLTQSFNIISGSVVNITNAVDVTQLNNTTASLNSFTASLKNAIELTGSTVSFLGNIVVYGTQSVISSTNVELSDNILYLAPSGAIDNDLGVVGHYNDGTYRHAGIFMDASDGHSWKVFNGLQTETTATVDTSGTGFALAPFKAGVITATSFNGIINATNGVISGSSQVLGGSGVVSGSYETTGRSIISSSAQITSLGFVSGSYETTGRGIISSSANLVTTSSFNSYTASISTASLVTSISNLNAATSSYLTSLSGAISSSSQLTSSYDTRYTLSGSISATPAGTISGSSQLTSSFDTRYTLSGSVQPLPSNLVSSSAQITAFGFISSSTTINTGSFVTTSSFNTFTASAVTTGSNTFSGSQIISGALYVTSITSISSSFSLPSGSSLMILSGSNIYVDSSGSITGSLSGSIFGIGDVVAFSSSVNSRINNIVSTPAGTISGSSQLTSSYDSRYVLSGSITQTTWDNIASKPSGIVSGSSQVLGGSGIYSSSAQLPIGLISGSSQLPSGLISGSSQLTSSYDGRYTQTGSFNLFTSSYNNWTSSLSAIGTLNVDYIQAGRITSDQTSVGASSDIIFNTTIKTNGMSMNTSTGVFTLTANKTYRLFVEISWSNFSDAAGGYIIYEWVDATTNTALDSTGTAVGVGEAINRNTSEFNATSATLIYTPTTNQTIKVRIAGASGTATVRQGIGTKAIIEQINPSFALNQFSTLQVSGSLTTTGSITSLGGITGSIAATNGVISGSSQLTSSYDTRYTLSGSVVSGTTPAGTISGSSQLTSSFDLRYLVTGSVTSSILQLNTFTSSLNIWTSSVATTGSNSFNGTQTITGSLNVSSVAVISSSFTANSSSLTLNSGSNLYVQNNGLVEITGSLRVSGSTISLITTTLQVGTGSGDEGGEILLAKSQTNNSLTGSGITIDSYQNRVRIFEQGGDARGVYIDITKAPTGVAGELVWKASGMVNAGTFVTLDNIKATLTSSSNRGLSVATVIGTVSGYISGHYQGLAGSSAGTSSTTSLSTTATASMFSWNFVNQGDMSTYILRDDTNNRVYRIILIIGGSYLNNFISIERLY